ncbi:MAG TPA: hypothetical protein VK125_08055 [Bacillota bacterium]|nr:hypothetical protein [Bacillota bacterium]
MLNHYINTFTGSSVFTRAYAYAILDFFKGPDTALLPAVFISSLEDDRSFKLWEETSERWDEKFANDSGNREENLKLQLICDGLWFYILFDPSNSLDKQTERLILNMCEKLGKENE